MNAQCVMYYTLYILNQEENMLLEELMFNMPVFIYERGSFHIYIHRTYTCFCCHPPIMLIGLFFLIDRCSNEKNNKSRDRKQYFHIRFYKNEYKTRNKEVCIKMHLTIH